MTRSFSLSRLLLAALFVIVSTSALDAAPAFRPEKLAQIDEAVAAAINRHQLPGGVLWLEHRGAVYEKVYGNRSLDPVEPMSRETLFDAASLTKVIATTPSIMLLYQRGLIDFDAPVSKYLPEFNSARQQEVTIRHLMTHTSGLRPGIGMPAVSNGYEKGIALALAEQPNAAPGSLFRYSDINFILLGEVVRRVSGQTLDQFAAHEIYEPLGMRSTMFLPRAELVALSAPTTKEADGTYIRGVVHDPTSRRMGGVAGHAGLFTTANDLALYARMLLNHGTLNGVELFKKETVSLMTSVNTPPNLPRRGLGWDIDSAYAGPRGKYFPVGSYGHTGWTGTSLWIDPFSETFLIFLSNRNHPTEAGSVTALRSTIATLAAEGIPDFNFLYVPGALERAPETRKAVVPSNPVLNGIDVLVREKFARLKGMKLGLVTNHTGQDKDRNPTIDLIHGAEGIELKALFSPEHGIRGAFDEKINDSVDEKTGLPVYSLYGERRSPAPEQLQDLDALVFDIQDVGSRFYTYISTMGNCLEAAAKANIKVFVLDRVNPINGVTVEGPIAEGKSSFTAYHPIPVRHGMTVGELARLFNVERGFNAALTVVPVEGWNREFFYDQTMLPWTNPSPNMRSLTEAILYPGIGLLETAAVSVGRGTDTPFEVVGAPYIDDRKLASELNSANLPGVRFVPVQFTPASSVFKGQRCRGVNIILTDRTVPVVDIGITVASALQRFYPREFNLPKFNNLLVSAATLESVRKGDAISEIRQSWARGLAEFATVRGKYLLYR